MTKWREKVQELLSRPLTWKRVIKLLVWLGLLAWKLIVWASRFPANSQASFFRAATWSPARRILLLVISVISFLVLAVLPFHSWSFTWTLYNHIPGLPQQFPAALVAKQHLQTVIDWTVFVLIFAGIRAFRARTSMVLSTFDIVTAKNDWDGAVSVHVDTPLTEVSASLVLRRVFKMTRELAKAPSVVRLEFHSPRLDDGHVAFAKRVQQTLGAGWQVRSTPDVAMSPGSGWGYRLFIKQGRRKPKVSESRVLGAMVVARRIGGEKTVTEASTCREVG